jgi:hypothetical protein
VTPCVSGDKRRFSAGRGKRPAIRLTPELGGGRTSELCQCNCHDSIYRIHAQVEIANVASQPRNIRIVKSDRKKVFVTRD